MTRINITPTILPKKIEDLREVGASKSTAQVNQRGARVPLATEVREINAMRSEFRVTLTSVKPVANEAGKAYEECASHLETPRPLHGDLSHHP